MLWTLSGPCFGDSIQKEHWHLLKSVNQTCFTMCPIESWCAGAVVSVGKIAAGCVVQTGITRAVINIFLICLKNNKLYVVPSQYQELYSKNLSFTTQIRQQICHPKT